MSTKITNLDIITHVLRSLNKNSCAQILFERFVEYINSVTGAETDTRQVDFSSEELKLVTIKKLRALKSRFVQKLKSTKYSGQFSRFVKGEKWVQNEFKIPHKRPTAGTGAWWTCVICHLDGDFHLTSDLDQNKYQKMIIDILKEKEEKGPKSSNFDFDEFCDQNYGQTCPNCSNQLDKLGSLQLEIERLKGDIINKSIQSQILRKDSSVNLHQSGEVQYIEVPLSSTNYNLYDLQVPEPILHININDVNSDKFHNIIDEKSVEIVQEMSHYEFYDDIDDQTEGQIIDNNNSEKDPDHRVNPFMDIAQNIVVNHKKQSNNIVLAKPLENNYKLGTINTDQDLKELKQIDDIVEDYKDIDEEILQKYPELLKRRAVLSLTPLQLPKGMSHFNINDLQLVLDQTNREKIIKLKNTLLDTRGEKIEGIFKSNRDRNRPRKNKITIRNFDHSPDPDFPVKKRYMTVNTTAKFKPKKVIKPTTTYTFKDIITPMMLVLEAVVKLNDPNGSSVEQIIKYLVQNHQLEFSASDDDQKQKNLEKVLKAAQNLVTNKRLEKFKNEGDFGGGDLFKIPSTGIHVKINHLCIAIDSKPNTPPTLNKPTTAKKSFKDEDEDFTLNKPRKIKPEPGVKKKQGGPPKYLCTLCNIKFIRRRHYQSHMSYHTGELPYECEYCDFSFANIERLKCHLVSHGIGQAYKELCTKCPQVTFFRDKLSYESHMRVHVNQEEKEKELATLLCDFCSKSGFKSKSSFHSHLSTHNRGNSVKYKCSHENCTKVFNSSSGLSSHLNFCHQQNRPRLNCLLCPETFATKIVLANHIKFIHQKEKRAKNHGCDSCPKKFSTPGTLRKHKWTVHEKLRPYSCTHCEHSFSDKSNLLRHEQMHRGERKFLCQFCSQCFIVKRSLRLHIEKNHPEEAKKL